MLTTGSSAGNESVYVSNTSLKELPAIKNMMNVSNLP
jgi:hypothetical protein